MGPEPPAAPAHHRRQTPAPTVDSEGLTPSTGQLLPTGPSSLVPESGAESSVLQDYFLPLGLGQAHSDHPHGSEATSGLDYSRAGDAAFSCRHPVALNSTSHLGPSRAAVGKDSASDRAAPRAWGRAAGGLRRPAGRVPTVQTSFKGAFTRISKVGASLCISWSGRR